MFRLSPVTLAPRSVLPLALFCAIGSPAATAATAGLCHYLTNTTIQNVSGHNLQFTSQSESNFSIRPALPANSSYPLALATGGVTGFSQTWATKNVSGKLVLTINDGQTNPQFQLDYWSGTGSSPGSIADALGSIAQETAQEILKDEAEEAALDLAEVAVPPPADAVIAAIKKLDFIYKIAKDIADAFQALGYLNIYKSGGGSFTEVAISVDTNQTHTVAIPGHSGGYYDGYVVSAISINNGCPNSWNVVVSDYCAFVCGYASGNNVPVADSGCLTKSSCSALTSNPLPGGSYTETCSNIKWKNSSTLSALCKDSFGVSHDNSLDYYTSCATDSTLSNNEGKLTCDKAATSASTQSVVTKPLIAGF